VTADLEGRVVVVTGGFGQLGSTYAAALAARGARVAIFDLAGGPRPGVQDLSGLIELGQVRAWQADVTNRTSLETALAAVEEAWGTPHGLVNNAAIDAPPDAPADEVGPFEDVPVESLERVLRVNVTGTVLACQVVGGALARAGRGSVVNISSIYGLVSPQQEIYDFRRARGETFVKPVAYSVSKSAVLNLTRYLATYWAARGVRVNTLTLAGVANDQDDEFVEAYAARVPLGRMLDASEAAGPLLFLLSDASSYVTGANLVVDGGWTAQ
jgi:NAD(P)-dependent dehydrogenase (short-subunit alcohol dehydrogenase family)